ncbi:hypothetical protein ACFLZ7_03340 [Nanoarchaeota archaeon]
MNMVKGKMTANKRKMKPISKPYRANTLRRYKTEYGDLFLTMSIRKELVESGDVEPGDAGFHMRDKLKDFFDKQKKFKEFIDLYKKGNKPTRFALLVAGGISTKDKWVYVDQGKDYPVQGWIDSVDSKYDGLVLAVSNPASYTPYSRCTPIVFSNTKFDPLNIYGDMPLLIKAPRKSTIDSKVIAEEVEALKRK